MGASNNGALSTTLRCKVAVVGNGACGKSALCKAFKSQGGAFPRQYAMTAGVDLTVAPVRLPPPPGPPAGGVPPATVNVELFLFDSGGQRMYKGGSAPGRPARQRAHAARARAPERTRSTAAGGTHATLRRARG